MSKRIGWIAALAALSALIGLSAVPARSDELLFGRVAGASRQVPNVPDRNGCVRMCEQDTMPCDPPIYKHADGRCTVDY